MSAIVRMVLVVALALFAFEAVAQECAAFLERHRAQESHRRFCRAVTKEGSPDFVPVPERIATFDNDGTLWAEQPMYFQALFLIDRVKALAPQHPEWKTKEPFASLLKGDMKGVAAAGEKGADGNDGRHPLRHDHRGIQQNGERLDRDCEASEDR